VTLCALSGCAVEPAPRSLFESRVSVAPLLVKLAASGGDPSKILTPRTAADLEPLEAGKRYKFVVRPDGTLAVAPMPVDAKSNEYVHPVLGRGEAVLTAGNVRVDREGGRLTRVTVDQDSKAYCPTGDSLEAALLALARLGVPRDRLRVENRPPACVGAEATPSQAPRYGALMAEVGARFERLGRAAEARRFELAEFERGEIEEVFEKDLPKAEPPRESAGVNLAGVADAFRETNLKELKSALEARDLVAMKAVYSRAAETCNGCHRSSGHAFIEIPQVPGRPVPRLDPVP
jgi:hypothetical protein